MSSKIAFVIPVYNTKEYLHKCLKSIINQTYKDIIIYIVNDGSTDGSEIICNDYANKYDNIILLNQSNKGLSCARNIALEQIYKNPEVKYIGFLDSDDEFGQLNMIEYYVNILDSDQFIDLIQFPVKGFYLGRETYNWCNYNIDLKGTDQIINGYDKGIIISTVWNKIYRRQIIYNSYFIPSYIYEDDIFNSNLLKKLKYVKLVNIGFYKNRNREGSLINSPFTIKKGNSLLYLKIQKIKIYKNLSYKDMYIDNFLSSLNLLRFYKRFYNLNYNSKLELEFNSLFPSIFDFEFKNNFKIKNLIKIIYYKLMKIKL